MKRKPDEFAWGCLPRVAHHATAFAGGGEGAVAYVSPDQQPEQYHQSFDASTTIALLKKAVEAIEGGDGIEAVKMCGAAWFRVSSFHHS